MASAVSTPTASTPASPLPLAPALASRPPALSVKPIAAAGSPSPLVQRSVTSKEWIIPPRPKPGRKPATDTPPTKRKAQNRAAQRAFRERRAARVGELEEQIKKIEEENEQQETLMKARISTLSKQLEDCRNELLWWKKRCQGLENDVVTERNAKDALAKELQAIKAQNPAESVPGGCENCSSARCQCIDDAFNVNPSRRQEDVLAPKRPHSPQQESSDKRQRPQPEIKTEPEELEIDFTSRFSLRRNTDNDVEVVSPSALFDPCGFCQDGTPCICAEMAADQSSEREKPQRPNKLAPIQNLDLSQFTPPPSDGDVFSDGLPSITSKPNPCANGPGTCAQCLSDPKSTLFCKSLAASRGAANAGAGCCGGSSPGEGCCQSRGSSPNDKGNSVLKDNPPSTPPITLSCADTFTTLSRHPNFARASDEINTWLPRLHTLPIPRGLPSSVRNRPAMEVEAASVMAALEGLIRLRGDEKSFRDMALSLQWV
ncbi:bZIP transcription factor HapX [Coccidioides immitis H538.4]|uniref:BZIP transcription factor HapX n=2 Tax=Coccidioides immitis TaxID=5501 RepID=A0A0J8RGV7_COCIT|nr:bZIP transcription factor HapX [Coccidioides immitis RMSCC 2394]KMU83229.1 bZIP transcription factor HapX [Coccidioides immitis H538.4]